MGKYNSSRTRVAPVFNRLLEQDRFGSSWLRNLLKLPTGGTPAGSLEGVDLNIAESFWESNPRERKIPPSIVLLRWLVQNLREPICASAWKTSVDTVQKRKQLLAGDRATIAEAMQSLDNPISGSWYILEGASSPDVFIETPDIQLLIEGKRTERKPTRSTSWMPGRYQMWRHIDCAWEHRGRKRVLGMMIVETDDQARRFSSDTVSSMAVASSLPHRTDQQQTEISKCFLGATTWKAVCDKFGLQWNEIVDLQC